MGAVACGSLWAMSYEHGPAALWGMGYGHGRLRLPLGYEL